MGDLTGALGEHHFRPCAPEGDLKVDNAHCKL